MYNQGLVVGRILQRSVQLPDMPSLLQRGEHALVHERQQDVALLVDTVLIRGLAKVGKEIGQDLVAIPRLGDTPSPLDPPCSSCGGKVAPIPMSRMVGSTGLVRAVLSAALDRHKITTREEDEEYDDLGLVTAPLKLKLGMNLCIRLQFKL